MPLPNPVESLYLTPRVVETAQHAGIIAFSGSALQMEGIYNKIMFRAPECLPPHTNRNNFIFVARWAGWFGIGRDIDFEHTAPDDPYLLASQYAQLPARAPRNEEHGWKTKQALEEMPDKTLVHLTFGSWRHPDFGWRVAIGLTPNPSHDVGLVRSPGGMAHIDVRRELRAQASLHHKHPFSVLMSPDRKPPLFTPWAYPHNPN